MRVRVSVPSPCEAGAGAIRNRLDVSFIMNMKLWIICGMLASIALVPIAEGAKKKTTGKKGGLFDRDEKDLDKKELAERDFQRLRDIGMGIELPEKSESLTDDMEGLDEQVTLTDVQKKKFTDLRTARDKILTNWDKVNRKKFELMQAGLEKLTSRRDMRKCKAIVSKLSSMAKIRGAVVTSYERKFFGMLTPVQRGKWNAPILAEVLVEEFSFLDLTEEQAAKIKTAADTQAKRLAIPLGSAAPPAKLTQPIMKYVYTRILTPKQRKAYAISKKQEAADRKRA
jgi:hypothetical protein